MKLETWNMKRKTLNIKKVPWGTLLRIIFIVVFIVVWVFSGWFANIPEAQAAFSSMVPTSAGYITQWTCTDSGTCATGNYAVVDEASSEDTTPGTGTDYNQTSTNNRQDAYGITNPTDVGGTSVDVKIHIYASTGSNATIDFALTHDSGTTYHALTNVGISQSAAWFRSATTTITCATYAASCQAFADAIQLEIKYVKSGGGPATNATVYAAFTEMSYTVASSNPTYTQNDFEWFIDQTTVTLTDAWPTGAVDLAENAVLAQIPAVYQTLKSGDKIRIQINVTVATANLSATSQAFDLQYAATEDCTSGSWASVGAKASGTIWRLFDNTSLGDNINEVNQISTSDVVGGYSETIPSQTNPNAVNIGQDVEWDWPVENNGATDNTSYCFRMTKSGGTAFGTYASDGYPKLTTAPGTSNLLRHGNIFQNSLEKGFFWAN